MIEFLKSVAIQLRPLDVLNEGHHRNAGFIGLG